MSAVEPEGESPEGVHPSSCEAQSPTENASSGNQFSRKEPSSSGPLTAKETTPANSGEAMSLATPRVTEKRVHKNEEVERE